jgi:hypothetical protein
MLMNGIILAISGCDTSKPLGIKEFCRVLFASSVAICIAIITTLISMHVSIVRMALAVLDVTTDCVNCSCTRGMLAAPSPGVTAAAHGISEGGPGGGQAAGAGGPSRTRGRGSRGGRGLEGESSSESE